MLEPSTERSGGNKERWWTPHSRFKCSKPSPMDLSKRWISNVPLIVITFSDPLTLDQQIQIFLDIVDKKLSEAEAKKQVMTIAETMYIKLLTTDMSWIISPIGVRVRAQWFVAKDDTRRFGSFRVWLRLQIHEQVFVTIYNDKLVLTSVWQRKRRRVHYGVQ